MVQKLGDTASEAGKNNVAFMANFMLGNLEECLEILVRTNRLPEAAFFARTYLPSEIARVLPLWKTELVIYFKTGTVNAVHSIQICTGLVRYLNGLFQLEPGIQKSDLLSGFYNGPQA
jgi:hypothetical protein